MSSSCHSKKKSLSKTKHHVVLQLLILEPSRMYKPSYYLPSYVTVNLGAEEKSLQLYNLCIEQMKGTCRQVHYWLFTASSIKSITSVLHQCLSVCVRVCVCVCLYLGYERKVISWYLVSFSIILFLLQSTDNSGIHSFLTKLPFSLAYHLFIIL